ncbi:MAG: radical SAM protein [Candidatus Omnitrophota bacterium]
MSLRAFLNDKYMLKKLITSVLSYMRRYKVYRILHHREALRKINILKMKSACPGLVYIESTNCCNAKCIMCPHSEMARPKTVMDISLFKKIADDAIAAGVKNIGLSFLGEPLLDKEIFEKVSYIKNRDKSIRVSFVTNAMLLSETTAERLISSGLDEVRISIDAITKQTYESIRVGLCYEKVVSNVKKMLELKKEKNVLLPKVRLAFLEIGVNNNESRPFLKYWKHKADNVEIDFSRDWAGQKEFPDGRSPHLLNIVKENPCDLLWKEMTVQADGKVVLCCNDYEGRVVLGDLNNNDIKSVWNSELYNYYRKKHINKERDSVKLCDKCRKYSFWW